MTTYIHLLRILVALIILYYCTSTTTTNQHQQQQQQQQQNQTPSDEASLFLQRLSREFIVQQLFLKAKIRKST
jgi:hypothetical protein